VFDCERDKALRRTKVIGRNRNNMRAVLLLVVFISCLSLTHAAYSKRGIIKSVGNMRFREVLRNTELPPDRCQTAKCDPHATCDATQSTYCKCDAGYNGNGLTCVEINGCSLLPSKCDAHASCKPAGAGTVSCTCDEGYTGHGDPGACVEVDKCTGSPCDASALCQKTGAGTYTCYCDVGFTMSTGRCIANAKADDSDLQAEAAKQIAALRNIQREAEMRQLQVEHDNKIGDLERRVSQLGRVEASDVDTKQDSTIKTLEDEVLKVEDVTMELSKRATDTNDLLKALAANRPVSLSALTPLNVPQRTVMMTPAPPRSTKHLATIVPRNEIQPLPLEPNQPQQVATVEPVVAEDPKVDVSKYSIAHFT